MKHFSLKIIQDDGPYGNDETRCFLLSLFSTLNIREICCALCRTKLNIYDRFPLVDGTFFVSPLSYEYKKDENNNIKLAQGKEDDGLKKTIVSVQANVSNKSQYVHAICLSCIYSKDALRCKYCKQTWSGGDSLQIGTMYRYEIFAAFPCCQKRFSCSKCDMPVIDYENTGGLPFFSSYSEEIECPHCKTRDFHFIKPLDTLYDF